MENTGIPYTSQFTNEIPPEELYKLDGLSYYSGCPTESIVVNKKPNQNTCLYTDLDIAYQQEYSGEYNDLSSCSTDVIVAEKDGALSGFGRPIIGTDEDFFRQVMRLEDKVWYLDFLTNGTISGISKFLLKQGKTGRPYYTQLIDLTQTVAQMHGDMRKSYQNLANKYIPNIDCISIDRFKKVHREVFGQCRSDKTYDIQNEMIAKAQAFVVCTEGAAGLFYYNKHICYYASGPSLSDVPMHPIIWRAMLFAKSIGCKVMELGQQYFSGTTKDINISLFKRGFGGYTKCYLEFKD